jgi:hypothetical protein
MTNQIILKEQLKMSGPVLILSHEHLSFSPRNKMIFIQSVKKYNINFPQKNMMFCILLFLSDRSHGQLFHVSGFSIDLIKEKKHYQNIYVKSRFITLYFHFI